PRWGQSRHEVGADREIAFSDQRETVLVVLTVVSPSIRIRCKTLSLRTAGSCRSVGTGRPSLSSMSHQAWSELGRELVGGGFLRIEPKHLRRPQGLDPTEHPVERATVGVEEPVALLDALALRL